ncbi:hypothetical protein JW949_04015 [Candidatus Woesearchaeota archaeon]|nr:hypothetical protein [Candidatus Woesearchaeota archaeon]
MKTKEECEKKIKNLTKKDRVFFTKRGNHSIKLVLKLMKELNKNTVLIQDQGGWLTYEQFIKKFNLNIMKLRTDLGIVDINELDNFRDSVLLINSMPAYAFLQNMEKITENCKKNNIILINDASGSIGKKEAYYGDIVFGSFGEWKPVEMKKGGFIATSNRNYYDYFEKEKTDFSGDFYKELLKELNELNEKLNYWEKIREKIKEDLENCDILKSNHNGINLIVRFNNEKEKDKIMGYCNKNNYPYTLCPRYIRVNENAVSIEIKRLRG